MTSRASTASHLELVRQLLGSGVSVEAAAAALGVSPSAISQLMANKAFAESVTELRYQRMQSHNERDAKYDRIEDRLLDKLEKQASFIMKPGEILAALKIVNSAKRRGHSAPEQIANSATVVNLTLPTKIVQKFTTNNYNQVVQVGDQSLHTIQSSNLLKQVEKKKESELEKAVLEHNDEETEAAL